MYTTGKSVMRQPTFFWLDLIPTLQKELVSGKHSQKSMAREVTGTSSGAEGWFFISGIQYPRFSPGAQGTYRNTAIYVYILKGECWCFSFLFLIFPFFHHFMSLFTLLTSTISWERTPRGIQTGFTPNTRNSAMTHPSELQNTISLPRSTSN